MGKVLIEESTLTAIGDSIRGKTGKTAKIPPLNMPSEISSIQTNTAPNLQAKTITPKASSQTVKPDSGYDGLSQVTVSGDADLKAANIAKGVNIFGVTGTLESGGKVASGSFTGKNNEDINISLGFKPKKIVIYLMSNQFFGDDELLGYFEGDVLYAAYDETEDSSVKVVPARIQYDDDDYPYFRLVPFQTDSGYLIPSSNGFIIHFFGNYEQSLAVGERYMYIAIG